MKETYTPSPNIIEAERKRLSEETEATDTEIIGLLINVYGGLAVANFLNWNAERITNTNRELES